jgi:hypothetical protein
MRLIQIQAQIQIEFHSQSISFPLKKSSWMSIADSATLRSAIAITAKEIESSEVSVNNNGRNSFENGQLFTGI